MIGLVSRLPRAACPSHGGASQQGKLGRGRRLRVREEPPLWLARVLLGSSHVSRAEPVPQRFCRGCAAVLGRRGSPSFGAGGAVWAEEPRVSWPQTVSPKLPALRGRASRPRFSIRAPSPPARGGPSSRPPVQTTRPGLPEPPSPSGLSSRRCEGLLAHNNIHLWDLCAARLPGRTGGAAKSCGAVWPSHVWGQRTSGAAKEPCESVPFCPPENARRGGPSPFYIALCWLHFLWIREFNSEFPLVILLPF